MLTQLRVHCSVRGRVVWPSLVTLSYGTVIHLFVRDSVTAFVLRESSKLLAHHGDTIT